MNTFYPWNPSDKGFWLTRMLDVVWQGLSRDDCRGIVGKLNEDARVATHRDPRLQSTLAVIAVVRILTHTDDDASVKSD